MRLSVSCMLLLMLLLLDLGTRHTDSQRLRLRPSPSDHLPVPDLKEDPDPEYDPPEQELSERVLRKKLGNNFDPDFMSVAAPAQLNATASPAPPSGSMPPDIRSLDLTHTPYGLHLKVGKKARRKFLQFLWMHTHCPVLYTWKDLGVRFWPRYVKKGDCFSQHSCSLPEGMFCKPDRSVTKVLLRWYCQGFLPQKYCTWIPVQYRIISECKCSC